MIDGKPKEHRAGKNIILLTWQQSIPFDVNQQLQKDAVLLQLQQSNVLEQQLKAIRRNTEQTEIRLPELQKEVKKPAKASVSSGWLNCWDPSWLLR